MWKKTILFPTVSETANKMIINVTWERLSSMKKRIYAIEGQKKDLNKWDMPMERLWMRKLSLPPQMFLN